MSNPNAFCVVYRAGGTENFRWHRTCIMTRDEAEKAREEVRRGGRVCHIENHARSISIGLPETYAP